MKTIKLDKIFGNELFSEIHRGCNMSDSTYNAIVKAMNEPCKQILELASENAVKDYPHDIKHEIKMTDCYGMSKRFYAACCAMQGLLAGIKTTNSIAPDSERIVKDAYVLADELLKQESE